MNYMNYFEELDVNELQVIDGGKNLLEYIAYGAGYLARVIVDNMPSTPPNMARL